MSKIILINLTILNNLYLIMKEEIYNQITF